jgi:hypothetical protein
MIDTPRNAKSLMAALLGPGESELSCEACFEWLDSYVECELAGGNADARVPGMRDHLQGCPACAEEHDSLHELLEGGPS